MVMSFFRVLGGILAAVAVMAALWAIAWYLPSLASALMLLTLCAIQVVWGWLIYRALKTGVVTIITGRYLRAISPIAYWGLLLSFIACWLLFLLGVVTYALIKF